jgi:hypothetical protein
MQRLINTLVLCLVWRVAGAAEKVIDFSECKPNETPKGFRSAVAGGGPAGDWKIVLDEVPSLLAPVSPKAARSYKRPVLAQLSRDRTDERFPLMIYDEESFGDFTLSTRFKIVEGEVEQIAGVAFRLQDERNFYYVRASALSGTFYFFKVVDGLRGPPIGVNIPVPKGVWHDLSIECRGTRIRVLFNGKEGFPPLDDKSFASGKIAFWTKSDAVSYFGETRIVYTPREILAQVLVRDALRKFDRLKGLKIYAAQTKEAEPRVIASMDGSDLGQPAPKEECDVIARGTIYYGKSPGSAIVTLPLHDRNGDVAAAVRVIMRTFPGQTEKNAIVRALPVVKMMEPRLQKASDLFE